MENKIITVLIGNSDNKLTQGEWSDYCTFTEDAIDRVYDVLHFKGGSSWDSQYQNACWVMKIAENNLEELYSRLTNIRIRYKQDSVAIIEGETKFI